MRATAQPNIRSASNQLNELPKLFHRGFIIGFLLPAVLFNWYVHIVLGSEAADFTLAKALDAPHLADWSITTAVLSIFLMALNRSVIRVLEGYGSLNPLRLLLPLVKRRFRQRIKPLYDEALRVDAARQTDPGARSTIKGFAHKMEIAVRSYPDREEFLLPTKFGNVYRAFEVYSRVTYGIDAIPAWPRLQLIIPPRVQDHLREQRSILDFMVNLLVLSLAAALILAYYRLGSKSLVPPVLFLVPVLSAIYAWFMLPGSAQQWGEAVKSVFDTHRERLARELGLQIPVDHKDERAMWREISRLMLFRAASSFDTLQKFRRQRTKSKRSARERPPTDQGH